MKQLILLLLILILTSCDYSLKSDRELQVHKYELEEAQQALEDQTLRLDKLELDMRARVLRDSLSTARYKDSIEFNKLTRIMCYQSGPHRHSCDTFN